MGFCCSRPRNKIDKKFIKSISVINERWRMYRLIASGNYGTVFDVIDTTCPGGKHYAMKIEQLQKEGDRGCVPHEKKVMDDLRCLGKTRHFPQVFDHGVWQAEKGKKKYIQFIVMTLLGPTLVNLAAVCPKMAFTPGTCASIGMQILEALKSMHEIGYLHRDIKPANINSGMQPNAHEIYLVDFGLVRKFVDETGKRLKPRRKAPFRGTCPYASLNMHRELEHCPSDDLWSMLYTLIDLRMGSLPWGDIIDRKISAKFKKKIVPYEWLKKLEPEYLEMYEYLTSIYFDITPDYIYFERLLKQILTNLKFTQQSPMDWEEGSSYYEKYYRKNIDDIFIK